MKRHFKPIEKLTFTDDYMFSALMKDPKICAGVIERVIGIKADKIKYPTIQKELKPYYETHGARFDIYVKDSKKVYDIEIQARLKNNLPKRARYYQSLIDCNDLLRGKDYSKLRESYIIFICKNDMFGKGLSRYSFKEICDEDRETELGDATHKIFVNAAAFESEKNLEFSAFLRYIKKREATTDFTKELESRVRRTISDNLFREMYLGMNLHDRDLIVEQKEKDQKIIRKMRKEFKQQVADKDAEIVAKKEEIAKLKRKIARLQKLA
ncbi:MAG: Rpn family recombination-promoting nuclease/putative transposase [Treponema sp.]|nr:Rpn family recombination-promoting nuclease/putative transposase [Treponema sp.]